MTGIPAGGAIGGGVTITRHFVTTASGRQVHYRRAGQGPAIVLCHESPLSSVSLADLVAWLSRRFTVIALDNPGYGNSDKLDHPDPLIGDYAEALAETLDALGIERAQLYGAHTGAFIVLEFAIRYPQRTAAVITDGLPVFDPDDTVELLGNYLPLWEPQWDGSHLTWAWMRYRDQQVFWPWFKKERAARLDLDMPSAEWLHEGVLDMLRAGDDFRIAYQAAFRYHSFDTVGKVRVPLRITARKDDLNHPDLDWLPDPLPEGVTKHALPRERAAWAAELLRHYGELPAGDVPPPAPAPARRPGSAITLDYIDTPYGQLFARRLGPAGWAAVGTRPVLLLHASSGSSKQLEPLQHALAAAGRETIAIDTLGNGDSDKPGWQAPGLEEYARVVGSVLDALGLGDVDVYGTHTGAMIGMELALQQPGRVHALVLDGITMFDEAETARILASYTPPLTPRWDGTHLIWAWNFLKDQTQFWPWFDKGNPASWRNGELTAAQLNVWLVELLKSGATYPKGYRAAFSYPTRDRLPQVAVPTLVCSHPGDPLAPFCEEAARLVPRGEAAMLPHDIAGQAGVIAGFLAAV